MSSLTSPGLIRAANEALLKVQSDINIAKLFAYDMSNEFSEMGNTVKVPIVGAGAISAFNISTNDYENPDGSVTYATVTLSSQPKSTFEFTGADVLEAPNAPYWTKCAVAAAEGIRKDISEDLGGIFLSTEITSTVTLSGDITKAKLAKLRKQCAGRVADTVLCLSPDVYAEALSLFDSNVYGGAEAIREGKIDGLYGFKSVVELKDLPTGVVGALIPSNAIAVASRAVAVADPSCYSEYGTVADDSGFSLTFMRHGSAKTGKAYLNCTTLWGVKVIQPNAVKLLVS